MQTRSRGWAQQYDVPSNLGFTRSLLVGTGPFLGIMCADYVAHPDVELIDAFDNRTECVIGLATGTTVKGTLRLLHRRSHPDDKPAPLATKAVIHAFGRHKHRVVSALAEAALYRGKRKLVMWSDEGRSRPNRLGRLAKAWGMEREMRGELPVYVRTISELDINVPDTERLKLD